MSGFAICGAGETGQDDFGGNNPGFSGVGCCDSHSFMSTSARAQVPFGAACKLTDMRVNYDFDNGGTETWTIYVNGSPGAQTVSGSASGASLHDATHHDTINLGDSVCTKQNKGSGFLGTQSISYTNNIYAAPATNSHWGSTGSPNGTTVTRNTTSFYDVTGDSQVASLDGFSKFRFKAETVSYMSVYVDSNSFDQTTTFTLRKNAATDMSSTVSFATTITGTATDITHIDTIVDNDNLCIKGVNAATTGTLIIFTTSLWQSFVQTQTLSLQGPKLVGYGFNIAGNGTVAYTNPMGLYGDNITSNLAANGTFNSCWLDYAATWTNLRFSDLSGTSGPITVITRMGGSSGNQTVTINTSQVGDVEDTTHQDTITSGQNIQYQLSSANGGFQCRTMTSQLNGLVSPGAATGFPNPLLGTWQ